MSTTAAAISTVRTLLERTRPAVSRDGYPPHVRARAVRVALSRRDQGASWGFIAGELGISRATLCNWVGADHHDGDEPRVGGRAFLPVVLSDEDPLPADRLRGPGLSLVSPRGYRVEGLDLESVAALIERLG